MNSLSNVWQHPKTSVAGVLIAVVTVAGVLSQQGVSLGTLGNGTIVTFISALASALLGLLAKDPDQGQMGSGNSTKLGAWLIFALLLPAATVACVGCTVTSAQLKSNVSALATALSSLSGALQSSDAETASKLGLASESLSAVVSNWDSATTTGRLNTVASGVETVLAGIPSTSKYAQLAAIAVAAVDLILRYTASAKAVAAKPAHEQNSELAAKRAEAKQLVVHRLGRAPGGDFKAAWNKAIGRGNLNLQPIE